MGDQSLTYLCLVPEGSVPLLDIYGLGGDQSHRTKVWVVRECSLSPCSHAPSLPHSFAPPLPHSLTLLLSLFLLLLCWQYKGLALPYIIFFGIQNKVFYLSLDWAYVWLGVALSFIWIPYRWRRGSFLDILSESSWTVFVAAKVAIDWGDIHQQYTAVIIDMKQVW